MGSEMCIRDRRSGSYRASIKDDCWCVDTIRKFEKGKIIAWAWLSRGLVSPTQITEWLHDGDCENFKTTLKQVMSFVSKECIHMYVRPSHFIRDTTHQSLGLFSKLALGATPCCSEYVIPEKMLLILGEKMLLICGDASTQKLYWELAAVKRLSAFSLLRTQECF